MDMNMDTEFNLNSNQAVQKLVSTLIILAFYYTVVIATFIHIIKLFIDFKKYISRMMQNYEITRITRIMNLHVAICLAFMFFPPPTKDNNIFTEEYRLRLAMHVFRFLYRSLIISVLLPYFPVCIIIFIYKFLIF
jgi:hypothetical protein